jgi:hypothetical protein
MTITDARLLEDDFDNFNINDLVERRISVSKLKAIMTEVGITDIVRLPEPLRIRHKMFVCFEGKTVPRKALFALVFDEVGFNIGLMYTASGNVRLTIASEDLAEY